MSDTIDKLMRARCRLMTREPWYGHISMSMTWIPSEMPWFPESQRTMGVRIVNGGEIQCIYYPKFVNSLTIPELYAVIQHEIEHIVRVHCIRIGGRNRMAWNIAADMTVNGDRKHPRIGFDDCESNKVIVPLKGNIIWIPDHLPKDQTSEFYYAELMKDPKGQVCTLCGSVRPHNGSHEHEHDDSDSDDTPRCEGCGQKASKTYSFGGVSGQAIDNHDIWSQSDVSADEARQVVKNLVDQANTKCRGMAPGHLAQAIEALSKAQVRWRELLRHYIGRHVGNSRLTYSRRNRRRDEFGLPGISHHSAAKIIVIVDTSGSISNRDFEQFFAEIDAISSRAKVTVLQWDYDFQGFSAYRRGDWKKFKVLGRGGTDMTLPLQWLIDNRQVADLQIMLTDGYTPWADPSKITFPMITVLTTPEGTVDGPQYGHVVRLKND